MPQKVLFQTAVMSYSHVDAVITEVHSDEGLMGIGQATISRAPYSEYGETLEGAVNAINNYLAPALIGLAPSHIETAHNRMDAVLTANPFAKTSIDIALHDLFGKSVNLPLYSLFGGSHVDNVPLAFAIGQFPTEELVEKAREGLELGYKFLKLRVGIDIETDIANLSALRNDLGENIPISVDFNTAMYQLHKRPDKAINYIKKLEQFNIDTIEQPVAGWDLERMAEINKAIDTPIVADECVWTLYDTMRVIRYRAADVIKIKLIKTGGFHKARKISALCEAAGVPLVVGHGVAGAIQNFAEAHFAKAMPSWKPPGEMNGFLKLKSDIAEAPTIEDGNIILSDKPGLGVEVIEAETKSLKVA